MTMPPGRPFSQPAGDFMLARQEEALFFGAAVL
jgi:hypothetical protein